MNEKKKLVKGKLINLLAVLTVAVIGMMKAINIWAYEKEDDGYREHLNKGIEYAEKGYYVDACNEFEKAASIRPNEDVSLMEAECYLMINDLVTFKQKADYVEKTYGNSERLYTDMMFYYELLDDRAGEIKLLIDAVDKYPDSEYLRECYDAVKGEYRVEGNNYEAVFSLYGDCELVEQDGRYAVCEDIVSGRLGNSFDEIYDVNLDGEIMVSGLVDGRISYYDKKGYVRVTPEGEYTYLGLARDGYALAKCDKGYFYIDEATGKTSDEYEDATSFYNNIAAVKKDGKWQIINSGFETISDCYYDDIVCNQFKSFVFSDRIFAKRDGEYVMLDIGCNEISKGYEEVRPFYENEGYAAVRDRKGWKLIDINGKVIECVECDELCASGKGIAAYRKGDKWGYIGVGDGVYVEPSFDGAQRVDSQGYAAVKADDKWKYIHFLRFDDSVM